MFKVKQSEDSLDFIIIGFVDPEREYNGTEIETWQYWDYDYQEDEDGQKYRIDCPIPVTKAYYNGWKQGFILGLLDSNGNIQEIGKVTSGLDDAMREDIAKNPDKYLNKCVEISCMSVDKDRMSVRHPVFLQVRFDKPIEDCLVESVFK